MAVAVDPAGKLSVTGTGAVVGAVPLFFAVIVYLAPVWPCVKFPVWLLVMVRSGTPPTVVGSVAVSLAVFVSPPPDTGAVFVPLTAFAATLTVSVMGG